MPHVPGHIANWDELQFGPAGASAVMGSGFDATGTAVPNTGLGGQIDWRATRTPSDDWSQFMLGVGPGMRRAPVQSMRDRLMTRYALASPYQDWTGATTPTFGSYLSGGPGDFASPAALQAQARMAAQVGGMSQQDFGQQMIAAGGPTTEAGRRLALMGSTFNPLQGGSASNMGAVAHLLALQRPATAGGGYGGAYQGGMASAIQNAMNAMYQTRQATGYDPNSFLSWYLGQAFPEPEENGNNGT